MRTPLTRRIALGLVLVAAATVGAQPSICRQERDVHVCQTEGYGTIINNDLAQAKDEAVIDGQRKALEQVAGVQVDAETITRNQVLFDQLVRTRTTGVIQTYRVLPGDGPLPDGRYRAQVEAWVKAGEMNDRLESLVSELSMVVMIPEKNMEQPRAQPAVENELVSRLVEAGYRVHDQAQLQRLAARDKLAALLRGDEQTAREIGLRFLANLIVTGEASARFSQNNQGIVSAYARVTARAMEADTGRIIANVSLDERGFGRDPIGAGEAALQKASRPAAEKLVQALDAYFKRKERRIDVRLRGVPSLDEYRRAKAFLEKQRWVTGVSEGAYAVEDSTIVLTYPEKTLYLAARIGREPRYRLVEFDRNRIVLDYRP